MKAKDTRLLLLGWIVGVGMGCQTSTIVDGTVQRVEEEEEEESDELKACDPPLSQVGDGLVTNPFGTVSVSVAGGIGHYRFTMVENRSSAIINTLTGMYVAGDLPSLAAEEVLDDITVSDVGCVGSVDMQVRVVSHMTLQPATIQIKPGHSFIFDVIGGSGAYSFAMIQAGAEGSVSQGGDYSVGASEGLDIVELRDVGTGETSQATVRVDSAADFRSEVPHIVLPVGATYRVPLKGGSANHEPVEVAGVATIQDGLIRGLTPGGAAVTLVDTYAGQSAEFRLTVVDSLKAPIERAGDYIDFGSLFRAKDSLGRWVSTDIDQDGYADVVLGRAEADVSSYNSGGVYIYAGGPEGVAPDPVRVLSGRSRDARLGTEGVLSDFNGDGLLDLAAGGYLGDGEALNAAGSVQIYEGVPGGFFAEEPAAILHSSRAGDGLGLSVTACDFNGDGYSDIAAGAYADEDNDAETVVLNQGSVQIFLGGPFGIEAEPAMILYGRVPDADGDWTTLGYASLYFGWRSDAGDIDGDSLCDLAVSSIHFNSTYRESVVDSSYNNSGAVFVFKGQQMVGADDLPLSPEPVRFYTGSAPVATDGRFGFGLALGDLDGDTMAEIVVGEPYANVEIEAVVRSRRGWVHIFSGGAFSETTLSASVPALDPAKGARWSVTSDGNSDLMGWKVAVADYDGDSHNDLLAHSLYDELPGGGNAAGTLSIFRGFVGFWPEIAPTIVFGGELTYDRFGDYFSVVGDTDGDGNHDIAVFASRADGSATEDIAIGTLSVITGTNPDDEGHLSRFLNVPSESSGDRMGHDLAFVGDVNNDGFEDLLVGAPDDDVLAVGALATGVEGINAGKALLYLGHAGGGIESEPAMVLAGFVAHNNNFEHVGWAVAPAGDFDGDGGRDFAIVGRYDDRPADFSNTQFDNTAGCDLGAYNNGGVLRIFRGATEVGVLPAEEPAFIYFGRELGRFTEQVAGGFDYNGDGYDDVVVSSYFMRGPSGSNQEGGVVFIPGRPVQAGQEGKTVVLCEAGAQKQSSLEIFGRTALDRLGYDLDVVADLNGDGCDELVAGAPLEQVDLYRQGVVYLFWGWGAQCQKDAVPTFATPHFSAFVAADYNAWTGNNLAAADLDGDGLAELAVGAPYHRENNIGMGRVWLVPGTYLATLADQAMEIPGSGHLPVPAVRHSFLPEGVTGIFTLIGSVKGEEFGRDVALIADLGQGLGAVAVGSPLGDISGTARTGAVRLYRYLGSAEDKGLETEPFMVLGGETETLETNMGDAIQAGVVAGQALLAVGVEYSSVRSLEDGAVLVFPLDAD